MKTKHESFYCTFDVEVSNTIFICKCFYIKEIDLQLLSSMTGGKRHRIKSNTPQLMAIPEEIIREIFYYLSNTTLYFSLREVYKCYQNTQQKL